MSVRVRAVLAYMGGTHDSHNTRLFGRRLGIRCFRPVGSVVVFV